MIISASYKTDIPAFYADWFARRLRAGHCRMVNPYGGQIYDVDLRPEAVDAFVFWTRNLGRFQPVLEMVEARGTPFVVQMTVMGYPGAIDRSVIPAERAVAQMREVRRRWGPRAAVWRYDPIVLSGLTPPEWHLANFQALAEALRGTVDEVIVSFMRVYAKTRRNMDRAGRRHGFTWREAEAGEEAELIRRLAPIADTAGMRLTLCAQPELERELAASESSCAVEAARCIDGERLMDMAGRAFPVKTVTNRPGCKCHWSRDIGAYDTCAHGCAYCYAVQGADLAKRRLTEHDPQDAFLWRPAKLRDDSG